MNRRIARLAASVAALLVVTFAAGSIAAAVTQSDVAYFDGFQDLTGVDLAQSSGVAIDALGGLRMATNGTAIASDLDERGRLHDAGRTARSGGRHVHARRLDRRRHAAAADGALRLPPRRRRPGARARRRAQRRRLQRRRHERAARQRRRQQVLHVVRGRAGERVRPAHLPGHLHRRARRGPRSRRPCSTSALPARSTRVSSPSRA